MKTGIYKITNLLNNKCYIGSAVSIRDRWDTHRHILKENKHHSIKLQRAWNKYSEENFTFEVIEECEKEKLIEREQYYLDTLKPEYNICKVAGSKLGLKLSAETKNKISKGNKGKIPPSHVISFRKELAFKYLKPYQYKNGSQHPMFGKKQTKELIEKRIQPLRGKPRVDKAKLTKDEVVKIREEYNSNKVTQKELSVKYNVNASTISDIINNITWRNI